MYATAAAATSTVVRLERKETKMAQRWGKGKGGGDAVRPGPKFGDGRKRFNPEIGGREDVEKSDAFLVPDKRSNTKKKRLLERFHARPIDRRNAKEKKR